MKETVFSVLSFVELMGMFALLSKLAEAKQRQASCLQSSHTQGTVETNGLAVQHLILSDMKRQLSKLLRSG